MRSDDQSQSFRIHIRMHGAPTLSLHITGLGLDIQYGIPSHHNLSIEQAYVLGYVTPDFLLGNLFYIGDE